MSKNVRKVLAVVLSMLLSFASVTAIAQDAPQTYTATAKGFGGDVSVTIELTGKRITNVQAEGASETDGIGSTAIDSMPGRMIERNSVEVDAVTGATFTSTAILTAAADALAQAGYTNADLDVVEVAEKSAQAKRYDTDVAVVGGGLAGLSAAISASENGAKVVLIEKLATTGGNAKSSLGSYMVAEVAENEALHVTDEEDDLDTALARWAEYQSISYDDDCPYPDYDRLRFMLVETLYTCDWLTNYDVTFAPKTPIADRGMAMLQADVAGMSAASPAGRLLERLEQVVREQGTEILLETRGYSLITEGDTVVGVKALGPDGEVEIYAKNVILACGSYAANPEMVAELMPDIGECLTSSVVSDTGDGINMALEVGAGLWGHDFIHPTPPGPSLAFYNANPAAKGKFLGGQTYSALMVDKDGNRFMNEGDSKYALMILIMAERKNGPYWSIHANMDAETTEICESGLASGGVVKADTIAELAASLNMDQATLEQTFNRYNELAASGVDEDFGKAADYLKPYGEGPYYAVQMVPASCDVLGGVKTDIDYRILREDDTPISGLWAAGSVSNKQYYNQWYFSGSSLTFATTSGRIAGRLAAESAK